jgi:predicted nucleotidyltransferase
MLTKKTDQALQKYQNALETYCSDQLERLILFGSQARGEATSTSDIDVLVVVNWETEHLPGGFYATPFDDTRWQQIVDIAYDVSLDYDVCISAMVMSEQQFQKWSPLVKRIKKEGIELWKKNKN